MSKVWRQPVRARPAAFQIHDAPSPSTCSRAIAGSPSRTSRACHDRRNRLDAAMSAHSTRAVALGRSRDSHSAGVAGSADGRLWATAIFRSRQPSSRVLTLPASTANSQPPSAWRNLAAEAVSVPCQRATRDACRSQ